LGVGGWVFGGGGFAPPPQSPLPNPQSPIPKKYDLNINKIFIIIIFFLINIIKKINIKFKDV
jgi:hypothetical protein